MCGFTILYNYTEKIIPSEMEKIKSCNQSMTYRGPDENGIWIDERIILGHNRLSIIGLDNGRQPIVNKNLVLVCNGEIYNFPTLKKKLINKGYQFFTKSDSEVILHLYKEYGEDCINHLDGIFAFCIYDKKNHSVFFGRDRNGQKPIYYSQIPQGVVICSELICIKKYFINNPELNYEILRQTEKYSFPLTLSETYIKQIKKIPPSNYATANSFEGLRIKEYYSRNINYSSKESYSTVIKKTRDLLFQAVEKRLQSEVPLGILLSAGIDSSAIACIAKELGFDVNVLCVGYSGNQSVDERKEAKRLSDEKFFRWNEIELNEQHFEDFFDEISSKIDEPIGDPAIFAQWSIYKKAKELGFTVLLSGIGGDELFYGYEEHNQYAKKIEWIQNLKSYFPIKNKKYFTKFLIKKYFEEFNLKNTSIINVDQYFKVSDQTKNKLDYFNNHLESTDMHRGDNNHSIDKVYKFLSSSWLTNNCYFLADKLGMGNSVEVRAPFSDKNLIEFIDSLPIEHKFCELEPKKLLKDTLRGIVPDYVLNRKKSGFTPPNSFISKLVNDDNCLTFPQLISKKFITNYE